MMKKILIIMLISSKLCSAWMSSEIDDFNNKIKELSDSIPNPDNITCDNVAAINVSGPEKNIFKNKISEIEQNLQNLHEKFSKFKDDINIKITKECETSPIVQVSKPIVKGVS